MEEDTEQTPVTLPPTQLIRNLSRSHNHFSKYSAPISWHCCVQPLQGEMIFFVFCNVPLEWCRGAQPVTHPGPHSRAPHRQREVPLSSPCLWPVQSQPGVALTHVSSCSQSSVLLWEAPAVLSPPCLSSATLCCFTWPTAPQLPIPCEHTKSRK